MRWTEVERAIDEYERRWIWVPIIAVGGAFAVIAVMAATTMPGLLVLLPLPAFAAVGFEASIKFRCPRCDKGISRNRENTEVLLLRNLHQCPHCQERFPD